MTAMLASINSVAEARTVLAEQVDIIDLKNPAEGALGRLITQDILEIMAFIDSRCPVSATIGDLPMQPQLIAEVVEEIAGTGVNYIKIGLFCNQAALAVIEKLAALSTHYRLIAVLFADSAFKLEYLALLKAAGFAGVMLDTFDKDKGSLLDILPLAQISSFVSEAKVQNVYCGLAGSLKLSDIPSLAALQPDYLGFRGALCGGRARSGALQASAVKSIKQALDKHR